jgi:hypothetical protein
MTDRDPREAMRQVAREVLREVVPEILAYAGKRPGDNGRAGQNGHARGDANAAPADPVPRVPAAPVAAVMRPSTWTGPPIPGEVIGEGASAAAVAHPEPAPPPAGPGPEPAPPPAGPAPDANTETVTIDTDADLERFVRALLSRFENPRDRREIRAGRIRFALLRSPLAPSVPPPAAVRIPKGAVTERVVRDAADRGVKLVLARGAVLTPLARDQARALGVEIEKEGRC